MSNYLSVLLDNNFRHVDNEKDIYFSACRSLRFHRQLCPAGFLLEQ